MNSNRRHKLHEYTDFNINIHNFNLNPPLIVRSAKGIILFCIGVIAAAFFLAFHPIDSTLITREALIGIATIVIFSNIPLAIASLQDTERSLHWDKQVVINQVIDMSSLSIGVILLFIVLPILLWDISFDFLGIPLQVTLFGFFVIGIGEYIAATARIYGWMSGLGHKGILDYKMEKRLEFLRDLPDRDKAYVWSSATWQHYMQLPMTERRKLEVAFLGNLKTLRDGDVKESMLAALLDDRRVLQSFNYVHLQILAFKWAFPAGVKYQSYSESARALRSRLVEIAFDSEQNDIFCSVFFKGCKRHMDGMKANKLAFLEELVHLFFQVFQENEHKGLHLGLSYFSEEWQVTTVSLGDSDDETAARIWLEAYLEWFRNTLRPYLYQDGSLIVKEGVPDMMHAGLGSVAQRITLNLFPNIELQLWVDLFKLELFSFFSDCKPEQMQARALKFIDTWMPLQWIGQKELEIISSSRNNGLPANYNEQVQAAQIETLLIFKEIQGPDGFNPEVIEKYIETTEHIIRKKLAPERSYDNGSHLLDVLKKLRNLPSL